MKLKKLLITCISVIAIVLGLITIAPSTMSFDDDGYNAKTALEHLQIIADKPHSVTDYKEHEKVRQYLLKTTKSLVGQENVEERNYLTASNTNPSEGITYVQTNLLEENNLDATYDIRNILAKIPGQSEIGILLVAHYDSRGNIVRYGELAKSNGAGDDGYGVVSLLEFMRYFVERKDQLQNSIYFLFADAEETNMMGSFLEARNEELMNKVNFVINVESRGMNGGVYMFETSKNNHKVMELYKKAKEPLTYSIAPAVYSVMTNYTDFTSFLDVGKTGLNFSTLNDINDYHVPSDSYMNVNTATLQHYGNQILPIIQEYAFNEKYGQMDYFESSYDDVFFNFVPGIFVSYNSIFAIVLAILCLIVFITMIVFKKLKQQISLKKMGKHALLIGGGLILSLLFGLVISLLVARLGGYPWSITNVRSRQSNLILALTMIAMLIGCYLFFKKFVKDDEKETFLVSAVLIQSVLNVFSSIFLSGASFMFVIPTFFGLIYLIFKWYTKSILSYRIVFYISLFCFISLFFPLITSLLYAMSIGGLPALVVLVYLPFMVLLPMMQQEISMPQIKEIQKDTVQS